MLSLSNHYYAATSDAARSQYVAAGEALAALFNGTAWLLYMVLQGIARPVRESTDEIHRDSQSRHRPVQPEASQGLAAPVQELRGGGGQAHMTFEEASPIFPANVAPCAKDLHAIYLVCNRAQDIFLHTFTKRLELVGDIDKAVSS